MQMCSVLSFSFIFRQSIRNISNSHALLFFVTNSRHFCPQNRSNHLILISISHLNSIDLCNEVTILDFPFVSEFPLFEQ